MQDLFFVAFIVFIVYPVAVVGVMWALRLHGVIGFGVAAAIVIAVLVLSLEDIEAAECGQLFTVVHEEQDPDGSTWWSVRVTPYMQANGTDSLCEEFGRCLVELIETSPAMGAVEIVDFDRGWVPSRWRVIDIGKALMLAGVDPFEEYAYAMGGKEVFYDD